MVSKAPLWATGSSINFYLWKMGFLEACCLCSLTVYYSRQKPLVMRWQQVMPFVIAGSCHCGKCICSAEEWYISGELCDCDDRDCDKHDGLICTGALWPVRVALHLVPAPVCEKVQQHRWLCRRCYSPDYWVLRSGSKVHVLQHVRGEIEMQTKPSWNETGRSLLNGYNLVGGTK